MDAPIPEVSFICLLTLLQLASWLTCQVSYHARAQPAWTRCRMCRSEQSIFDYVLIDTDCFSSAPPVLVFQADVSDLYLVHIDMGGRAHRTDPAPRLACRRFHVRKLQDLACMLGRFTVHTWRHIYRCLLRRCSNWQPQMNLDLRSLRKHR